MKTPHFPVLKTALALTIALAGTTLFAAEDKSIKIDKAVMGESLTGAEWKNVKNQKRKLANKILNLIPSEKPSDKEITAFLKAPENRILLNRWYFTDTFGNAVAAAASGKEKKVLFQVLSDEDWLNGFLYSGRLDNTDNFLPFFMKIAASDKKMQDDPVTRKIAVATAGEYSRQEQTDDKTMLRRYRFFAKSYREELLNSTFKDLDYWDMRIICGWASHNGSNWGNETSLRWSRDNVKQPEAGYASRGGEIHQLNYRLFNICGDTVQGADYYRAYVPVFTERAGINQAAMSYEVGAVCGGVSHYGASAAIANGVPAVTMGEPGHCAFATRNNGKWIDNNSIEWKRSTHWTQTGEREWAFLFNMQDAFSNKKDCIAAMQRIAIAKLFQKTQNLPGAAEIAVQAIETQPINYIVWQYATDIIAAQKKQDPAVWQKLNGIALQAFCKKYPNVGARCLQKLVYPRLMPLLNDDKKKVEILASFWNATETHGPASWEMETFFDAQKSFAGTASDAYLKATKAAVKGKQQIEGVFDNWAAGNEPLKR